MNDPSDPWATSVHSIRLTQSSPFALTKWPWERAYQVPIPPEYRSCCPQRRSMVSSMANPQRSRWDQVPDQLFQQYPAEDMVTPDKIAPPLKAQLRQYQGHRAPAM